MNGFKLLLLGIAFAIVTVPVGAAAADKAAKVIDFEDEVVEGMNKQPLDSLAQISERDKKRHRPHLYRKRVGFRTETQQTVRDLRYVQ